DPVGTWAGMVVESLLYAGILCGISRAVWPMMHALDTSATHDPNPILLELIRYVGAGLYEEMLFRLLLFTALLAALTFAEVPRRLGILLAALASALLFAGAHNFGAPEREFQSSLFLFRACAGFCFAWIFCIRGFGIAVGAHAGYDVLVGLLMKSVT